MPDLAWWLQNFKRSAFRLECLPEYNVPQEAEWFAAFKRDGSLPHLPPESDSWLRLVSTSHSVGRFMQRVRLVSAPLSDYERFELALFPPSVEAGEDIRIMSRTSMALTGDFWLFDDEVVIFLHYDDQGRFLRTEQAGDVVPYRRRRDLALEHSIPLAEYTARAARH